jgi:hypothetical protein
VSWKGSGTRAYLSIRIIRMANSRKITMTAGHHGAAVEASISTDPTQEGRAVTDQTHLQDPEPYTVPSTGFLVEYDQQIYEVVRTGTQVELVRDPQGREQHKLEIRIQAVWSEEGYQNPAMDGLL